MREPPVQSVGRDTEQPLTPSQTLLNQVRSDEADAWVTLSQIIAPLVYSWCRRSGLQPEDAADVVQEVLMSVRRGVHGFRRDDRSHSFRGWLWTITHNRLCTLARQNAQRPIPVGGSDFQKILSELHTNEPEMETTTVPCKSLRMVDVIENWALKHFEERTWQAFKQTAVEGQSAIEASQSLGMSLGAIRQAKHKVRKKVRDELGDLLNLV